MAKSAKAVPTIALNATVVEILNDAANRAVRDRNTASFMATWKLKIVKWGDEISADDVSEATEQLFDLTTYVREFDELSRAQGHKRDAFYAGGGDGREVVSPDNYNRLLELSDTVLTAITREEDLAELGFTSTITSPEVYEDNIAWYKQRLGLNHREEEVQNILRAELLKGTKKDVKSRLSNLK